MVKPDVAGGAGGGKNDPERDKISNLPCKVTTEPGAAGCLRVTLLTVPLPLNMQTPLCRLRAKVDILSVKSHPLATSITWDRRAFALSRVMIIGGLGLFFDPAGRPLGLLEISPSPPNVTISFPSMEVVVVAGFSSSSRFWPLRLRLLLPLCSSSEFCCCWWW